MEKIKMLIRNDIPVLLWGAPGVGKTASIVALAKEQGVHLEVLIGSTMDPTDLGRPIVTQDDEIKLIAPPWVDRIVEAMGKGQECWLMLDELTCAPPSIQAVLLRVVNERKVCDIDISGCRIIGAANPPEQAADGIDLSVAMSNRWSHNDWSVDHEKWIEGEISGWGSPSKDMEEIRSLVCGWIEKSSGSLIAPPQYGEEKNAWPSPRTWSMLCKSMAGIESAMSFLKTKDGRAIVRSLVGHGAGAEFCAWIQDMTIPSAADILSGKSKIPDRGDLAMMCMNSIVSYCVNNPQHIDNAWNVVSSARPDMTACTTRKMCRALENAHVEYEMTDNALKCIKTLKA